MTPWQEDLLAALADARSEEAAFQHVAQAAQALGFVYCAYGRRMPLPLSNPRIVVHANYPAAWQERYAQAGYLRCDPSVVHARRSQAPLLWSDELFRNTPDLRDESRDHGLRHGWAQSCLDSTGTGGMLTLARDHGAITPWELQAHESQMSWLAHTAHVASMRFSRAQLSQHLSKPLTERELEVLKWTADGKSSQEIAQIFVVSKCTVDFHIKNAILKLQAPNKTAAVVRAALMGLLN